MSVVNAFEAIRAEILTDDDMKSLVGENILFGASPLNQQPKNFITLNYSELNGGSFCRQYELKFTIVTTSYLKTAQIKEKAIELLDRFNDDYGLKNDLGSVQSIQLVNGNEIIFNPDDKKFYTFLYFRVIL